MPDKPKPPLSEPPVPTDAPCPFATTLASSDFISRLSRPIDLTALGPGTDWARLASSLGTTQAWRPLLFDTETNEASRKLESTIADLRRKIEESAKALQNQSITAREKEQQIADLKDVLADLQEKQRLSVVLDRVSERAQRALLTQPRRQEPFMTGGEHEAFVMAVDIRRSTELMLKARRPEQFAAFLTTLCRTLEDIVKEHHGVFDKFTGDGILAFFPEFFSGPDTAFWCLSAADRAHDAFKTAYREHRSSFNSILTDVGLGIGVDFGSVHVVQVAGGVTVVGPPVVYACRFSGAPAGRTYLNQPAYEKILERISGHCFIVETSLELKHEGPTLAYDVRLTGKPFAAQLPDWALGVQ